MILFAVIYLFILLITNDFSYLYVYNNSSKDLEWYYRISALWAGKEGSFLLWIFFVNIFGIIVARSKDESENILMLVINLTQLFLLIMLVIPVESPFRFLWDEFTQVKPGQLPQGIDGQGMNPLLIDPWMILHPPMLFLGYASATIPFAYAVAALLKKDFQSWLPKAYKWLLFSMVTLGIGIFFGGYWAYSVLGWGGFWGWDPVENSSLIPWLIALALMHAMILQKRKQVLHKTTLLLTLTYFVLVLFSTFLTRSGVLSNFSVHSFAGSISSWFILPYIIFFSATFGALMFKLRKDFTNKKIESPLWSTETFMVFGIIALTFYSFIILAGTMMPKITGLFMANPSPVTANFYNKISMFIGPVIIIIMITSTILSKKEDLKKPEHIVVIILSLFFGFLLNYSYTLNIAATIITIIAMYAGLKSIQEIISIRKLAILPSRLTHLGTAILAIGVMMSGFYSTSQRGIIVKNQPVTIGGLEITLKGYVEKKRSVIRFHVKKGNSTFDGEALYYYNKRMKSFYKAPFILPGLIDDYYIVPENYISGLESITTVILKKGETKKLNGRTITFKAFDAQGMQQGKPEVYAIVDIDGKIVKPGFKIDKPGHRHPVVAKIPGTKITVSLNQTDVSRKMISLFVSPGDTKIPADKLIVEVATKKMIWLVWLGTILIIIGGSVSIYNSTRRKSA